MTKTTTLPLSLTPDALSEIKHIIEQKSIPEDYGLRVGKKTGSACAGGESSYVLGFDKKSDTDDAYIHEGIDVYIDRKDMMYIIGVEIDFVNTNTSRGFVFNQSKL